MSEIENFEMGFFLLIELLWKNRNDTDTVSYGVPKHRQELFRELCLIIILDSVKLYILRRFSFLGSKKQGGGYRNKALMVKKLKLLIDADDFVMILW